MSTVHNPNNWHWIDKNCINWANSYFQEKLPAVAVTTQEFELAVTNVKPVTGDCDVTQRKGKVRCIFDMNIEFNVKLTKRNETDSEPEDVVYDIKLLEFEHDQDDEDYQFDIRNGRAEYKSVVKSELIPEALKIFTQFQPELLNNFQPQLKHNTN